MQCPSCNNNVQLEDKNIGALYTCAFCQSVYFINFDGTPDYQAPENQATENQAPQLSEQSEHIEQVELVEQNLYQTLEQTTQDQIIQNQIVQEELNPLLQNQFEQVAQEIENFGNQPFQNSALSYDLSIYDIDSQKQAELVLEALEDEKFGWIEKEFKDQVKKGYCKLKGLTPIEAFILMKRLYLLDLKIEWKQNVL